MALVMAQATVPVWPKWAIPGTPGTARPTTSNSGQDRRICWYTPGSSMNRCGSPAMTACPVTVRSPATSQPLLPEVPGPSAANRPTASAPRCVVTCSRQSLAGKPAKRMCVASQTASGVQGSQRPGASPARSNSGAGLVVPADSRPSLTPVTYARTHCAVSGSRCSSPAKQRRAVSARRARRAKRSQGRASGPRKEAEVPWARWRSTSSCQARSRAVTRPWARASSCTPSARRCGMPQGSRKISPVTVPSFHFRLGSPK